MQKSACLRFGPRFKNVCASVMVGGRPVNWVTSARYLGIYLESSFTFKCSFAANKAKFYKAFNSIGPIWKNWTHRVRGRYFYADKK